MLLPQIIFLFYIVFIFIAFFFSYYLSYTKEESTIDSDFTLASVTVEAEKELGSLDDMLLVFSLVVYIFGWYFYSHC
jgi:hypothetical protein